MIVLAGPTYSDGTGRGDVITMFAVIEAIAQEHHGAFVAIQDAAVRELLPLSNEVRLIDDLPAGHWRHHNVLRLDVHEGVSEHGKSMHPARMFFEQAGLDAADEVPRPRVNIVRHEGEPYDYVIAPFTNNQAGRGWPLERWVQLQDELLKHGHRKIAIVGGPDDEYFASRPGIQIIAGSPLPIVAGVFANARCVITVDSMANRLAHAVGAQHLLLHGRDATPTAWAYGGGDVTCAEGSEHPYPGGIISADRMSDIAVATVLRFAQGVHG